MHCHTGKASHRFEQSRTVENEKTNPIQGKKSEKLRSWDKLNLRTKTTTNPCHVLCQTQVFVDGEFRQFSSFNGLIYTGDGSSVWDELGQRTIARLIIRLCINTGKQTDHPSWRLIHDASSHKTDYRDSSCGWIIRLLARIYTLTDYQTSSLRSRREWVPARSNYRIPV